MTMEELREWLEDSKKDLVKTLDKIIPLCKNDSSILNETLEILEELETL